MNAYGSYGEFENKLWYLEQDSYGNPITIGILICDATKQNEITNRILTDMKDFDSKSEEFINFYIPAYCSKEQMNSYEYPENYKTFYETKWEGYYFSSCLFNDFLAELRTKNIEYKEEPELILVEIVDGQIHWEKRIIFPLLTMEKKD